MSHKGWQRAAWSTVPVGFVLMVFAIVRWANWYEAEAATGAEPLGWLEPLTWIVAMLSFPLSITGVFLSVRSARKQESSDQTSIQDTRADGTTTEPDRPVIPASVPPVRFTDWKPRMRDRDREFRHLRRRLVDEPWGVVVVSGDRGIGKSRLVAKVLKKLPEAWRDMHDEADPQILWYEVVPGSPALLDNLIADLESLLGDKSALGDSFGLRAASPDRLKASLEALQTIPVMIVIEQAENLLNPAGELVDAELDEAFEVIATAPRHEVTVILVTRVVPKSPARRRWPTLQFEFPVGKLSQRNFEACLGLLDTDKRGLKKAVGRYYKQFQGNLHLAELAYAVLALPDWNARRVADELGQVNDVSAFLIDVLLKDLGLVGRRVLQALNAYGTPIDADAVHALLAEQYPADQVTNSLVTLTDSGIVQRTPDGQYYLSPTDDVWGVEDAPEEYRLNTAERSEFFRQACVELAERHVNQPRGVADLRYHFAELRAMMRASLPDFSYRRLQDLDAELRKWNAGYLLLEQRVALRGQFDNPRNDLANENSLGGLYAARGDFLKASEAYGKALEHAEVLGDLHDRTRIRANLAGAYWWNGDTEYAQSYYELVLDDCEKLIRDDPEQCGDLVMVRMGALEGLANCHRHRGQYVEALQRAKEALGQPASPHYPDTEESRNFADARSVAIALKLAHWHTELGRPRDVADEHVDLAEHKVNERDEDWLWARYLNGLAALWLQRRDFEQARMTADKALELAVKYGDAIVLPQARTTLCAAYLLQEKEDLDEAARQIQSVLRYQRPGPLFVQALRALIALAVPEDGPDAEKANTLFKDLHAETVRRLKHDPQDFTALDYQGFALCGLPSGKGEDDNLESAIRVFRKARERSLLPTPNLVDHLILLLRRLDQYDVRPGRLQPVIEALSATQPHV